MTIIKRVSFLSILFSALLPLLTAQPSEAPPVRLVPVAENLYQIDGGRGSQGGAYIGETGVLLVDAKMDRTRWS